MRRKEILITGETYHIFSRSIANYTIFNHDSDFTRMLNTARYYQIQDRLPKFSDFCVLKEVKNKGFLKYFSTISHHKKKLVQIIAYCLMPTHLHFILRQLEHRGISVFMGKTLNSYAKYFNCKHRRKGPLWGGDFKNVLVKTEEQLHHLTRYIHLNPTSAGIVNKPEDWQYSSYHEYISKVDKEMAICYFKDLLDISSNQYKKFVEDRISYQRDLEKIKNLILE